MSLFDELRHKPALSRSFWVIVVRFFTTSLTSILALHMLNRGLSANPFKEKRFLKCALELSVIPTGAWLV